MSDENQTEEAMQREFIERAGSMTEERLKQQAKAASAVVMQARRALASLGRPTDAPFVGSYLLGLAAAELSRAGVPAADMIRHIKVMDQTRAARKQAIDQALMLERASKQEPT